ncbi:hypothetical protein [Haloferula sp. BvORR071]|uniref:hypothetical protein n=1 Tax=Haloferula sp. BvORR071 TaxID=1396141 RepID=UPI00054E2143|nr:hypothetical protein [Haloferula sp. BvORR071]
MKRHLLLIALLAVPAHAEPAKGKASAYQGSVAQEQLRLATAELETQLAEIATEYGQYRAAEKEVAQVHRGIQTLQDVTSRQMPEVSALLLAASRSNSTDQLQDGLRSADERQKQIQVKLREVADQLSRQAAAGAMRERLEQLLNRQTTNLRKTLDLAKDGQVDSHQLAARKTEQANLEQEIKLATESLRQLAQGSEVAPELKSASSTAEQAGLENQAKEAAGALDANLADAAAKQQSVRDTLQSMTAALDAARPPEERAWELAAEMAQLAAKEQENSNKTRGTVDPEQAKDRRSEQSEVTDKLDAMQPRVAALDPALGEQMQQANATSRDLAEQSTKEAFSSNPQFREQQAKSQRDFSQQLAAMGTKLQEKAMAAQNAEMMANMSPQEQALRDAINKLTEARAQSDDAYKAARDEKAFAEPLTQTDAGVAAARAALQQAAGPEIEAAVKKDLNDVQERSIEARKGRAEHHIYRIREGIDRSLASLQNIMNQMALANMDQQQPGESTGQGEGEGGLGKAAGKGGPVFNATAAASKAQRDAVSLLQQEKVAPEYEPMVKEYIKKLAEP